ncbi:MAG: LysR family transcriptional regulator [Betaproteobacteria bacterium]|nr:LysR family transcriptional regulator [Betaproteobacteria bacterium]
MELRHLRYFVAVARSGSFTAAAAGLGIQQPPLSQQVRDLEREVGCPLFVRLPRGVALTAGGTVFLEEAEAILARVDGAVRRAGQAAHGTAGTLSVGFTSSAVVHRLSPVLLRGYREANPGVELSVGEGNAASLSEAVAAGQLDMAFIRQPVVERSGLAYHQLANEPLLVALPMGHPVAVKARRAGRGRLKLRDLAADPFILVRRPGAPGMYGDLIEACHAVGFAPRIAAEVGQMLTNVTLVAAGVGVSVVPASMRVVHAGEVFYGIASDAPKLSAPLNLVTRIGSANPTLARFVAFARKRAREVARAGALLQS